MIEEPCMWMPWAYTQWRQEINSTMDEFLMILAFRQADSYLSSIDYWIKSAPTLESLGILFNNRMMFER